MWEGSEWSFQVRTVKNEAMSKRIVDRLVALAFLAVGWLSTGAPTISDPFYRYTPRDWLFVLLLILATVPYAWRRRWPTGAFLISTVAVTVLWLLGYNAGALPLMLMFGGYFVAVARRAWEVVLCSTVALGCFALLWWAGGAPQVERGTAPDRARAPRHHRSFAWHDRSAGRRRPTPDGNRTRESRRRTG